MGKKSYIGLDIGSEYLHAAVLNQERELVFSPSSRMHLGNPGEIVREVLGEIEQQGIKLSDSDVLFTGSGGQTLAKTTGVRFFYDTITLPTGAEFLDSEARYIFHIGAQDTHFYEKDAVQINGQSRKIVLDYAFGTKCGGGSGILIGKTVRRFFTGEVDLTDPEKRTNAMHSKAYQLALQSDKEIYPGGRCGIIMGSDMIHLQNAGEKLSNILKGLFERIPKNYKQDVTKTRVFDKKERGIATGGVCANPLIVQGLERNLGISLTRPEHYRTVCAIGAALMGLNKNERPIFNIGGLEQALELERKQIGFAPALSSALDKVKIYEDKTKSEKIGNILLRPSNLNDSITDVYLGIDGGSTTTKAVFLRACDLKPIGESILLTHGRPLEAIQNIFRQFRDAIGNQINIKAVAYTGSSGEFYYKLFTKPGKGESELDIVKDEITCHAFGVKQYHNGIRTIAELGGQDAKITIFKEDGTVYSAKMNLSCMAGTGQTMENMREMAGIRSYEEFEDLALRADRTPIIDDTCGVFTEAGISKLISLRLPKREIAAAIAYGFIGGYAHKFVGNERITTPISAQGGPFNNRANLAALALHFDREIFAFPHRQLFGAYGAAIIAHHNFQKYGEKQNVRTTV